MTQAEMKNRRKIKLINRDFQIGLMAKFIAANCVMMALFGVVLYLFLRGEIQTNLQSAHAAYRTMGEMLFPIILTISLLVLGLLSVTIVFVILYASHRIAGPLYRFHQVMKDFESGNLRGLTRIREDDQLAEIAETMEKVRGKLATDVKRAREALAAVQAPSSAGDEAVRAQVAEAREALDSYLV